MSSHFCFTGLLLLFFCMRYAVVKISFFIKHDLPRAVGSSFFTDRYRMFRWHFPITALFPLLQFCPDGYTGHLDPVSSFSFLVLMSFSAPMFLRIFFVSALVDSCPVSVFPYLLFFDLYVSFGVPWFFPFQPL